MQDAAQLQLNFSSRVLLAGCYGQQLVNASLTRYGISLSVGAVQAFCAALSVEQVAQHAKRTDCAR